MIAFEERLLDDPNRQTVRLVHQCIASMGRHKGFEPMPLNCSHCVACQIWRKHGVSPHRGRAHRLQRRGPLRGLLAPMDPTFDLLQTAINCASRAEARHRGERREGRAYRGAGGHMTARYWSRHPTWKVACSLSGNVTVTASPCTGLAHHTHSRTGCPCLFRGRLTFAMLPPLLRFAVVETPTHPPRKSPGQPCQAGLL